MVEGLFCFAIILFAAALAQAATRGDGTLNAIVGAGLAAAILATFAQIYITQGVYGGGGDMFLYIHEGEMLARYVRLTGHVGEVVDITFGGRPKLPFLVAAMGTSTGSTAGLTGLFIYYLGGRWGAAFGFAMLSFTGKLSTFSALRSRMPVEYHARILGACVLVPSLVFWSSAILKESITVAGLGWLILGLERLSRKNYFTGSLLCVAGYAFVSISKAYMFFPLAASSALAVFWTRGLARQGEAFSVKPGQVMLAILVSILLVLGLGQIFPRYALGNIAEEASYLQSVGSTLKGGSNYSIGASETKSLAGQLIYAPLAILTTLLRPLLFEARNGLMFVNALETSALLVLLLTAWRRLKAKGLWELIKSSPTLIFCIVMTILTALGVGLTTTNLGTLSRYRVPMFPFYVTFLLVASKRVTADVTAPSTAARPRRVGA